MKKNKKRFKKLVKVLKKKWFKPTLYTVGAAILIYTLISHTIFLRKSSRTDLPHFVITHLSDEFNNLEFMHLLLCIQELRKHPASEQELINFVNTPFPAHCPDMLKMPLKEMNWAPHAFHTRVHKMFKMLDSYDQITRLDETISFLSLKFKEGLVPLSMEKDIEMLQQERDNLIKQKFTPEEYEFMQNYAGLIQTIRSNE